MSPFPTTQWTLIELANNEKPSGSRDEMGRLLRTYWQPMHAHLRYKGISHEKAEDLIQEFMIEILNKDILSIADPKRGKFRTLLLTALDRFAISQHRHDTAAKRAPQNLSSLDAVEGDQTRDDQPDPSAAFERAWALEVLAQVMGRMQQECQEAGEINRWLVFERRIVGPLLDNTETPDYGDLTKEFNLANDKAAMNLLVTAKRQFARTLRDHVRQYVTRNANAEAQVNGLAIQITDADTKQDDAKRVARQLTERAISQSVEEEIQHLKKILGQTWSVADLHVDKSHEASVVTSGFWDRISKRDGDLNALDLLYDWDQEGTDNVPQDVLFQSLLDGKLSDGPADQNVSVRECLCGESPKLELLEAIKQWANNQRVCRSEALPIDQASALYYSAIAAALLRCNKRISGLNGQSLRSGFRWVSEQPWIDPDVRTMVVSAINCTDT
ncbi:hypothetical protein GC197_08935 [bacterium]|nr:hypothetical protein [bacterium]